MLLKRRDGTKALARPRSLVRDRLDLAYASDLPQYLATDVHLQGVFPFLVDIR